MKRVAEKMLSYETIANGLHGAGFKKVASRVYRVPTNVEDSFLYSGRHRPYVYLDAAFRAGISAFVTLGIPEEIAQGCARLQKDIDSEEIQKVIDSYLGESGDCLYIIGQKD
jgi:hypothetical protein